MTIAADRNPEGQDRHGLGAQHESANSSEYFPNTPGTHTMTNTPNPGDQAVEAVAVTQADTDAAYRHFQLNPTDFFDQKRLAKAFARHRLSSIPTPPPADIADLIAREQAVMVCPQCEGEGGYPDGVDEAACHTDCTRCGTNGWIVDLDALQAHASPREVRLEAALQTIEGGSTLGLELFSTRMEGKKSPTWYAVNVLQDNLAACRGTARTALEQG